MMSVRAIGAFAGLAMGAVVCLGGGPALANNASVAASEEQAKLVTTLLPSVVNITILKQRPNPKGETMQGAGEILPPIREVGSGFIIDPEGYVLTNRHVINEAYKVTVVLHDGTSYLAKVLSSNAQPDLALLKIDVGHPLPAITWADSDALMIGQTAIAIGNPLGLATSVTVGVVSAVNRDLSETSIDNFIQTDAAINHGNSGGPLFDSSGHVIGINTQLISPTDTGGSIGIGIAIPSNEATFVVDEMRKFGKMRPGYIGLTMQQLTPEIAQIKGLKSAAGGIVSRVTAGGPASRAGLQVGDVVLQFGDRRASDIRALIREILGTLPGQDEEMRIWRNGKETTLTVSVAEWPQKGADPVGSEPMPQRGPRMISPTLGMRVAELTADLDREYDLDPSTRGVIVLGVAANSIGADTGFARLDVLLRVDDTDVASIGDFTGAIAAARTAGHEKALVLLADKAETRWVAVPTSEQ